jgi:hypothetical protein
MTAPTRYSKHLFKNGCQYYIAARFAVEAQCFPVCGNLFHHAVEMMLKGALASNRTAAELKRMSHNLAKLWDDFRKEFPDPALSRHDATIATLDNLEFIRYPDQIIGFSVSYSFGFERLFGPTKYHGPGKAKSFEIVVSEIDDVIADVIAKAPNWYPGLMVNSRAAYEAVIHHNHHGEFLAKAIWGNGDHYLR